MLKRHLTAILLAGAMIGTATFAQEEHHRGPQISSPTDGATISGPVTVTLGFGGHGGGDGPHGPPGDGDGPHGPPGDGDGPHGPPPDDGGEHHGHHGMHAHPILVIDQTAPATGTTLPTDAKHVAFPQGERSVTVTLPAGPHSLQLVFVGEDGAVSDRPAPTTPIKVTVK